VEYARQLLEEIGLEGRRLQMINISAAMAGEFAFSAAEITADIQRMGPNPLHRDGDRPRDVAGIQGEAKIPEMGSDGQD
jgi:hypothetical protein